MIWNGTVDNPVEAIDRKMHDPKGVIIRHLSTLLETWNIYPLAVEMILDAYEYTWKPSITLEEILKHKEYYIKITDKNINGEDLEESLEEFSQKVNTTIVNVWIHKMLWKKKNPDSETPLILTPELLKKLKIFAYKKQLKQILGRPANNYSWTDASDTEETLRSLWVSVEEIQKIKDDTVSISNIA